MSQTSVSASLTAAKAGLVADGAVVQDKISKVAEEELAVGVVVVAGTDNEQAALPSAAAEITAATHTAWGVTAYRAGKEPTDAYAAEDMPVVLRKGRIWMVVEDAVAANTHPYVRFAAGTGTQLGALRSDADTATAEEATWLKTLTASAGAGIILVEVHLP